MSGQLWLYKSGAEVHGPVSENDIVDLVGSGVLSPTSTLRSYGPGGVWTPVASWKPGSPAAMVVPTSRGWTDTSPHPWRRYLARIVDYTALGAFSWMLIGIVFYVVSPTLAESFFAIFSAPGGQIVDGILTVVSAIPLTTLMIGLTGTSLGKWIFGVKVVGADGRPIGVLRALRRELSAWFFGVAGGIPLLSLFTLIASYNQLTERRTTRWDVGAGSTVLYRTAGMGQTLLGIVGVAIVVALRIWFIQAGRT